MLPDVVPPTCVALLLSPRNRAGPIREHQDRPICPPPQSHCCPLTRWPLFSVQVSSRRIARCARALCFWPSIRFVRPGFGVVDMQFLRHGPPAQHRVRVRASAHVCGGGDLRILWVPSVFRDPVLSAHPKVFFPLWPVECALILLLAVRKCPEYLPVCIVSLPPCVCLCLGSRWLLSVAPAGSQRRARSNVTLTASCSVSVVRAPPGV